MSYIKYNNRYYSNVIDLLISTASAGLVVAPITSSISDIDKLTLATIVSSCSIISSYMLNNNNTYDYLEDKNIPCLKLTK